MTRIKGNEIGYKESVQDHSELYLLHVPFEDGRILKIKALRIKSEMDPVGENGAVSGLLTDNGKDLAYFQHIEYNGPKMFLYSKLDLEELDMYLSSLCGLVHPLFLRKEKYGDEILSEFEKGLVNAGYCGQPIWETRELIKEHKRQRGQKSVLELDDIGPGIRDEFELDL